LPDSVPTLAEILRGAGYATGGFVGGPFLRTEFGLARGFDRYVQPDPRSHGDVSELLPQVFEWIRSVGDRPYFLFVNVFDPHAPYDPPPLASSTGAAAEEESPGRLRRYVPGKDPPPAARDIRSLRALYEAEIREADRGIGRLLAFLESRGDLDGDCLIAVTADHGEAFGENGHHGHGAPGYETQVHVPLLLFAPGRIPDGIEFDPVVETRWLFPTILESAGVDRPEGTEGENLAELAATGTAPARDVALVERFAGEMPHFTVRRGPYKYYRELRPGRAVERIVDLREDPEEVILFKPGKLRRLREIDPDRTERLERALRSLREVLDRHLAESVRTAGLLAAPPAAPPSREASSQALSPEARELLLRLGYLQGEDSNE
jgi:arylsulfatase A-like enzyme